MKSAMIQGPFTTSEGTMTTTRLKRFLQELVRPTNAALAVSWTLFAYFWLWGWNDDLFFDFGWWFDTAGHAIFGFFGLF